jgi:hypothetical protein
VIAVNIDNYGADQLTAVIVTGRYSTLLASDLDSHIRNRSLHSHLITDDIAALEGGRKRSQTKPEKEYFKRKWLKGLWHTPASRNLSRPVGLPLGPSSLPDRRRPDAAAGSPSPPAPTAAALVLAGAGT